MVKQRISTSFSRYTDANFDAKAKHIVESMTDNPDFPSPNPNMEDVGAAVNAYSAALLAAANLGRTEVAEKNEARSNAESVLGQLGNYVMNTANGDLSMLTGSGYTLFKQRSPRHISSPGNVTLSNGLSSGELKASVKGVAGANGYLYEITDAAPTLATVWSAVASSSSKYTFTSLLPGKQYWIRVAVTGSRQQVAYSPVATQFAQ